MPLSSSFSSFSSSTTDISLLNKFTPTLHTHIPAHLDPSLTTLPRPFSVLVLGASRGIGAHIALAYAAAGASHIILAARSTAALHDVARQIERINATARVACVPCDIANAASVERLARAAETHCADAAGVGDAKGGANEGANGALDVVVVNSGLSGPVVLDVAQGDPADFQQVTDVSYVGTYHAAHYLVPLLLKGKGVRGGEGDGEEEGNKRQKAFLTVGSMAAALVSGIIANTAYCISKLAQAKLVEHVHEQYREKGLLVVGIHPGAVKSQMAMETAPEEFMQYLTDDPALCGAWCVWLTKSYGEFSWLGGRLISATWDPEQLLQRKDEIVDKDLLKIRIAL